MTDLETDIIQISHKNIELLKDFLSRIEKSKKTFRYYDNRDIQCIKNHLVTLVCVFEGKTIAYGHLDKEGQKVWLGVCVADLYHGKGLGKKIMKHLLEHGKNLGLENIELSVDIGNKNAYHIYEKFGFVLYDKNEKTFFMKKVFDT